jgi:DNA-binding transcriptional ArsR family regulator
MDADVDLAPVAALIADPSRAAMLAALMGGEARSASDLAAAAGVAASTASEHLTRLEDGGLVRSRRAGRRREVELASADVARALEALGAIAPARRVSSLREWRHGEALRAARSCYDHLAGVAGVALADALVEGGVLRPGEDGFAVTPAGEQRLAAFGVDVDAALRARRATARACLDWSERRPHLGGALGAALLGELLRRRWLVRARQPRVLAVTTAGREGLADAFGLVLAGDAPGGEAGRRSAAPRRRSAA